MTVEDWSLSDGQRQETVGRVANNISAMAFFAGSPIADDVVQAAAAAIEKKAYTVARVEARTTTGVRCARAGSGGSRRRRLGAAAVGWRWQGSTHSLINCWRPTRCSPPAGRTTRRSRPM